MRASTIAAQGHGHLTAERPVSCMCKRQAEHEGHVGPVRRRRDDLPHRFLHVGKIASLNCQQRQRETLMLIEGQVTVRHDDFPLMALDIIEESMVIASPSSLRT